MAEQKKPGLGSNPLRKLFGAKPAPASTPALKEVAAPSEPGPRPVEEKSAPAAGQPAFPAPAPAPAPAVDEETATSRKPEAPADHDSQEPAQKREAKPSRMHRIRRRHRSRQGDSCTLHPGESKRAERVTIWLTPEEREDLELLSMAEGLSDSSLGRQALLDLLEKYKTLIGKARGFRESLTSRSA